MKRQLILCLVLLILVTAQANVYGWVPVTPTIETEAVNGDGDDADDCAIWIHPFDPAQSTIIGESKGDTGGLEVFDLTGKHLQTIFIGPLGNLDLRYNFPLGGQRVAIVVTFDRSSQQLLIYKVNPATRLLEEVTGTPYLFTFEPYGGCLYHSPVSGKYYFFENNKDGVVEQLELFDNGQGKIDAKLVRSFDVGSQTEGCVADDVLAKFYIGEEDVAVWKYGAEPGEGTTRTMVDKTGRDGHLKADIEGLCLYYKSDQTGYLIVSSQGDGRHLVYRREAENSFLGDFKIEAQGKIDAVTGTDGCDVSNFPLGPAFPNGVYVAHDSSNTGASTSNYKLVPFEKIAAALGLKIDLTWDPRKVGAVK